jgi:hypothetical protein
VSGTHDGDAGAGASTPRPETPVATVVATVTPLATPTPFTVPRRPMAHDPRGSIVPPWRVVSSKFLELRKRRGLMVAVLILTVGILVVIDGIFLILHAADPNTYGPAGGLQKFRGFSFAFIQTFGIAAVLVGAAAGSTDLSDGVFRHLVATGRSRVAIFIAKVPAGLLVIIPVTAVAYALEAIVATYFAPSGNVRTITGIQHAFSNHGGAVVVVPNAVLEPATPPIHVLVQVGLWLMLQVLVAFVIGLGLGSLTGSRSATVAILIALQLVVTPLLSGVSIPHLVNLQRAFVGVAMAQLEPSGLTAIGGGGPNGSGSLLSIPAMPVFGVAIVISAWVAGWLALGAWRAVKRDA